MKYEFDITLRIEVEATKKALVKDVIRTAKSLLPKGELSSGAGMDGSYTAKVTDQIVSAVRKVSNKTNFVVQSPESLTTAMEILTALEARFPTKTASVDKVSEFIRGWLSYDYPGITYTVEESPKAPNTIIVTFVDEEAP